MPEARWSFVLLGRQRDKIDGHDLPATEDRNYLSIKRARPAAWMYVFGKNQTCWKATPSRPMWPLRREEPRLFRMSLRNEMLTPIAPFEEEA
jgi:hypothetical protein